MDYSVKLMNHYLPLIKKYGASYRAVDWGSKNGQHIRFKILSEVGDLSNSKIIDIGCGNGGLVEYLNVLGFNGDYLGIDIIPEMIESAQKHYKNNKFNVYDILSEKHSFKADYVIGSGLFTFSDELLMRKIIKRMYKMCSTATAFNSLSSRSNDKQQCEYYADPISTLTYCLSLTPWVTLRQDYLLNDFTIYMYKRRVSE